MAGAIERNIRSVPEPVGRHARSGLPGRLGVNLAGTASARPQSGAARYRSAGVPGRFRDVAQRRPIGAGIVRGPVRGRVGGVGELRSTHASAVWRGAHSVHARHRSGRARWTIAARRAAVARRHQDGHALRGRLLPQAVPKLIPGRANGRLAIAEAETYHRRDIMVHDVLG